MSWGVMAGHMGWGVIEEGWRKGPWTAEEDRLLTDYVRLHGEGRWNSVARLAGLKRNGKSCRLRWVNYLRPDLKRGQITPHEESIILELHARWGNRWSTIARSLPGRTDNEIKNYWRTHFKKKAKVSADNSEKAKSRLLRRQQFQQQQQQLQMQQQQQQEFDQVDMKRFMSLLEGSDNNINNNNKSFCVPHQVVLRPENIVATSTNMQPHSSTSHHEEQQQQSYLYSMLNCNNVSMPEALSSEDMIMMWDGLWNLDDAHANNFTATTKASLHNLVTPFC